MRKLKVLWRNALSRGVREELETWTQVLLAVGAALLLYATLKAQAAADTHPVIGGHRDTHFRPLAELAIGDELTLERPDGRVLVYEVTALDVVDSERAELRLDADESIVVLVTGWPFDAVTVGGSWRYVVTARVRI
jgi:LPXTG-site transpeptidase (sortase) family protein